MSLWCDMELRQHIVDTAKLLNDNRDIQRRLVAHAWFILGEYDAQKTTRHYKFIALCMMHRKNMMIIYGEDD